MASEKVVARRRYSAELKERVVAECDAPGASVAKVAMSHGLNANVVHGWRQQSRQACGIPAIRPNVGAAPMPVTFMPIALPEPSTLSPVAAPDIRIEIKRGATTLSLRWPSAAANDCGEWLREWLR
jgi:transposase